MISIFNPTDVRLLDIHHGDMVYLKCRGSQYVGDIVQIVKVEKNGIIFYLSPTFSRLALRWEQIAELAKTKTA